MSATNNGTNGPAQTATNPASTNANAVSASKQSSGNDPLTVDQAFELFDKLLERSEERVRKSIQTTLPHHPADPFSLIKRKADDINNEGIKKQYIPLEKTKLRMEAARDAVKKIAEGGKAALGPKEAAQVLQKTLDEGLKMVSRRISHLQIAETEGWSVAKHTEKNQLLMEFSEDL
jgi:hypothetical protein